MNPVVVKIHHVSIVYDADRLTDPEPEWFTRQYWLKSGQWRGSALGRGNVLMLDGPFGQAVLRRYLRGGWAAKFSRDRYLFTGVRRSRAFREFDLTARLAADGLPVAPPLAGSCEAGLLTCRGALITERIDHVETLDAFRGNGRSNCETWQRVGRTIRRFHDAGLDHADLNARNILVSKRSDHVWLVDFDRCRYTPGSPFDGAANLARLRRSLRKLAGPGGDETWREEWRCLVGAYHE